MVSDTMQDPQSYEDDAGNVYVQEGNRWRVIRPDAAATPAAPQAIPGLIPMQSPSDRRAEEALRLQQETAAFQRERAMTSDAREQRRLELAEEQAGLRGNRYQNKFDEARATRDATRFDQAMTGWADAPGLEAGGQRAERLLEDGAPVGAFADQRIAAGRIAGDFLGFLPGIPNREQVQQLEQLRLLGSQGALGDVSQLKGPLSEKELAFIQRLQIDPNATRETNMQVAEAMQWAARRQAAYGAAMERWVQELGSPSAPNANGLTFNAWWGQYASRALPRPGSPEAAARREDPVEAVPIAANGEGGDTGAGPGSTPDNPFDFTTASREEVIAAVQRGGWFRQGPDGQPYQLPPANPEFGTQEGDQMVAPGVAVRPRDTSGANYFMGQQAFARSALEQVPFADEIAAGIVGAISPDMDYREARQAQRGLADVDREVYPVQRNVGGVAGATAQLIPGVAAVRGVSIARAAANAPRAERLARFGVRAAQNAGMGAGAAGVYAAGAADGGAGERVQEGVNALAPGALAGAATPYAPALGRFADDLTGNALSRAGSAVGNFAGRQASRMANALGVPGAGEAVERFTPNPLNAVADRLATRLGPDRVNALAPRAARYAENGVEPTLVDALDDAGQGLVRAAAMRDTDGRQEAINFAQNRARNLPTQARRIATEEISDDARPALDIIESQKTIRRNNADAIQTFGNDPVPVSPDVITALRSDFVRPHLAAAARRAQGATDPVEREASARLSRLADMALDNPSGAQLTVRDAQDISRALNDAATAAYRAGSPDGPVLANLANTIRGAARDNSDGYAKWLRQYGEDSDLIEAATRGRNFISVSQNPIDARSTESFVRGATNAGEAEQRIQRAASREAVEAASSNPRKARTVLDAFAGDLDQSRRAEALGVNPERLRNRSRAVLDSVRNAENVNPRAGSSSILNAHDTANLAGVGDVVRDVRSVMRNPLTGPLEVIANRFASRGFNNQEAEQLVRLAIDPARTNELIDLLSQRMSRREARNLARATRFQVLTTTQTGQQLPE